MPVPVEGDIEFSVSEKDTGLRWNVAGEDWANVHIDYGAGVTSWPPSAVLTAEYSDDNGRTWWGFGTAITWTSTAAKDPIAITGATDFRIRTSTKSGSASQRLTGALTTTRDRP